MRRERGLAVLALGVAVVCGRLGWWQLDRLGVRRTRNVELAARREAAPLDLATTAAAIPAESVWQRRVAARGVWDWTHERVWPGRTFEGVPGVAVITPLRLAEGTVVLVDRGWVPSPDARTVDLRATREADSGFVVGLAFRAPRAPGDADPVALGAALGVPVHPFVVLWLPDTARYSRSVLPVRRWPAPSLDDGPHLGYAIQWFAFAAIALGGAIAVWRTPRTPRSP